MQSEFYKFYTDQVLKKLQKDLKKANVFEVPKIKKVSINVGMGTYLAGGKDYDSVVNNITQIAGQKAVITKARMSVSNFKIREGNPVGVRVTLRRERMYDFLQKLVRIVFPRVRDFRGISPKSFDGQGNYSVGIKEFAYFPEIKVEDIVKNHGLQITIETTAKNNQEGYALLKELGFPFKKDNN